MEKQEQLDELWTKYSRLLQRTKTQEKEELETWQVRAKALADQIKSLKAEIKLLQTSEQESNRIADTQVLVRQVEAQQKEIAKRHSSEVESDYQKQIDMLNLEVEHVTTQKQSLVKLL